MIKVFIDGQAGTTGLQIEARLRSRNDIELLTVEPTLRKDREAKQALMERADVIFLCLPDEEARISAAMAPERAIVIDASTAHRTATGWVYGLPELSTAHRTAIADAKRIANPGCHATGFIALVYPLLAAGLLSPDAKLSCTSLTGYSGGGRGLIETYEMDRSPGDTLHAPRPYALELAHKHLSEMRAICGLSEPPIFVPVLGDMAQGMLVSVPLWADSKVVWETLAAHYEGSRFIRVMPLGTNAGAPLDPTACNGTNRMELSVFGHGDQALAVARLDNLGKGASGAALQCMNIACGLDEGEGLNVYVN